MFPTEQELGDLFRELRPEALETVLDWFPRLHAEPVRDLLGAAVQRIAAAYPDAVANALGSENPAVVRETVRLAGRLRLPPTVPALGGLLIREVPSDLKASVVHALAAIRTPSAMQQLERAVVDPHRDVRVAAVRVLGARGHRAVLPRLEAMVAGRDLRSADLTEKTAFFEAFGALAGPEAVGQLIPLLELGGGLFKKKMDSETRACAAGYGKILYPELNSLYRDVLRYWADNGWPAKLAFFTEQVLAQPANLALLLGALSLGVLGLVARLREVAPRHAVFLLLLATTPLLLTAFAPTPAWYQYYFAYVPLAILTCAVVIARLHAAGLRQAALLVGAAVAGLGIALGIWDSQIARRLQSPATWVPIQVHQLGLRLAQDVRVGPVLTLAARNDAIAFIGCPSQGK